MTKLDFTLSVSSFDILSFNNDFTADLLGANVGSTLSLFLADDDEMKVLRDHVERLTTTKEVFSTFNLVFKARTYTGMAPEANRSPLHGVFRSPIRAIHTCGEKHLACFVSIQLTPDGESFHLIALEYSRSHRESMIRQEFGSWLLEEHVEQAVIATDALGLVVFWNRFASELYQWTKEEAIGKNIMELTPSEMTQEQGMEIMGKLMQGQHWKGFFGVQRKDSSKFIAHVTDTPILDNDDTLRFIVGVSADYTQMHNLMEELKTLNADLEEKVAIRTKEAVEFRLEAEKAAAASRSKTEMMQMLSHEFRTPLQGIMGVSSTMLSDLEEGSVYDCFATISASSRLLLTLINNVLDLGKMDADKMTTIETCTIPVLPSIQDSLQFCHHFALLNDVSLVLENEDTDLTIQANQLRLDQILVNLLSNGIKYTAPETSVVVSVRQCLASDMVIEAMNAGTSDLKFLNPVALEAIRNQRIIMIVISIRDHGRGIPEEEMPRLFGEFVQLKVSLEKDRNYDSQGSCKIVGQSSGSGLGLNLVMKFVSRMGGHIWVKNCEHGGAVFSFCFPKGVESFCDEDSSRADSSRHLQAHDLSKEDASALRVLVVDDSVINQKVIKRMLERLGVKEIHLASDGLKALEYLGNESPVELPNVILSDLNMPNIDGYELIRHIRQMNQYEMPPKAMACSADWTRETEQRCTDAGFDGVLRKPITFTVLQNFLAETATADAELNED
jgi:PAS domain S-box-containing protein